MKSLQQFINIIICTLHNEEHDFGLLNGDYPPPPFFGYTIRTLLNNIVKRVEYIFVLGIFNEKYAVNQTSFCRSISELQLYYTVGLGKMTVSNLS